MVKGSCSTLSFLFNISQGILQTKTKTGTDNTYIDRIFEAELAAGPSWPDSVNTVLIALIGTTGDDEQVDPDPRVTAFGSMSSHLIGAIPRPAERFDKR